MRHRTLFLAGFLAAVSIAAAPPPSVASPPPAPAQPIASPQEVDSMPTKVFFLTATNPALVRVSLRRFARWQSDAPCHHDACVVIVDSAPASNWPDSSGDHPDVIAHDDARWPSSCERCGYAFTPQDEFQIWRRQLHTGAPDGKLYTLQDAPIGAMWDASWMRDDGLRAPSGLLGPDDLCLVVKTPGGDWMVDSRASNCTLPNDTTHKCWVRHGDPRTGEVHVDKNGLTCAAGAGSIMIGKYHGFLHNSYLTDG